MRRSTAARPGEPRPLANRSSIAWISRATPGDPQGTLVCVAHRTLSSDCMGSSSGRPHRYSPRAAPGMTSTMPEPTLRLSQVAASRQYIGMSGNAPLGVTPPVATGTRVRVSSPADTAIAGLRTRTGPAVGRAAMPSAMGSRTSASNLWRLRSGASGPSNRARTCSAQGWARSWTCPAVITNTPVSTQSARKARSGVPRRTAPVRPSAATRAVATTSQGTVAWSNAAGIHGLPSTGRNEIQLDVPRSTLMSEVTPVVAEAVSMNGRNEKM